MQTRILTMDGWNNSRQACCWALLALASLGLPAQELTLRMDVKLVNVFVNVIDQNGRPAAADRGLRAPVGSAAESDAGH